MFQKVLTKNSLVFRVHWLQILLVWDTFLVQMFSCLAFKKGRLRWTVTHSVIMESRDVVSCGVPTDLCVQLLRAGEPSGPCSHSHPPGPRAQSCVAFCTHSPWGPLPAGSLLASPASGVSHGCPRLPMLSPGRALVTQHQHVTRHPCPPPTAGFTGIFSFKTRPGPEQAPRK